MYFLQDVQDFVYSLLYFWGPLYAELLQSVETLKGPLQMSPFANGAVDSYGFANFQSPFLLTLVVVTGLQIRVRI